MGWMIVRRGMKMLLNLFKQALIAIDQLANTLFYSSHDHKEYGYGFGMADETISARSWRLRDTTLFWKGLQVSLDIVFFWDAGLHCYKSYLHEYNKHQLPPHYKEDKNAGT